jgi:mannosyltransferase
MTHLSAKKLGLSPQQPLLLVIVLLLAAILRIHGLGRESFWFDEALAVHIANQPWVDVCKLIIDLEQTPPLHFFILKIVMLLAGSSEIAMRAPSVVAGVISVWLLYRLVAFCAGPWEGIVASLLLAVSRFHIGYSQEARTYALTLALALWSSDEYVRLIDSPRESSRTRWREIRYCIATILLLYSHLYAVFVPAAQIIHFAFLAARRRSMQLSIRKMATLQTLIALAYGFWLPVLFHWYHHEAGNFWLGKITAFDVVQTYWDFANPRSATLLLVFAALIVVGCARMRRSHWLLLLLLLLLLPTVVPVGYSILTHPLYLPRYGTIALIGFCALSAAGIASLARPLQALLIPAIAAAMLIAPLPQLKPDFRTLAAWITQYAKPGDIVCINAKPELIPLDRYLTRTDLTRHGFWGTAIPLGLPMARKEARVWLILIRPVPPQNGSISIERGHWHVVSQKLFSGLVLFELDEGHTEPSADDELRAAATRIPPAR